MRPVPEPAGTFAALLRQLRTSAGLTQEELARAANLSHRSISDLERGINLTARRQTARLLADALRLTGAARAGFEATARGATAAAPTVRAGASGVAAATRTLPRDITVFTGREPELQALLTAATQAAESGQAVSIHSIGGMAGVGKSAFAVHAAHRLTQWFPDGQVFLPLHAHTPGQRAVDPADALASLLLTAGIAPGQIPAGLDERVGLWRDHLAGKRLLLVLDDAASHDQVRPLLPGTAGSLVLVTSRKHLTALDDAQALSLDTLTETQAALLLSQLAGRPDLAPGDAQVREIARLCGFLPLAIGMLARHLQHHPAWSAADLADELAGARYRLELMQAENVSVAAAFDLSYQDLTADQQRLFRNLGLHPGAEIDAYAASALDGSGLAETRRRLGSLYDQYLLAEPARGRYRLHDLVREHARLLAGSDPAADREAATDRLAGYYVQVACTADRFLARGTPAEVPGGLPAPAHVPALATRDDAVAWLEAERVSLHALIPSAAPATALTLAVATHAFLRFRGYWDQASAQHAIALDLASRLGDQRAEAMARANQGDLLLARRDYPAANVSLGRALELYLNLGDKPGEAAVRTTLASASYLAGDNAGATSGLVRALDLYRELGDRRGEALALTRLASVQLLTGDYQAAASGLPIALSLYRELGDRLGEAQALGDLGAVQHALGDDASAAACHEQALAVYRELGDQMGVANALLDLAGVQHASGDDDAATAGLTSALALYQDVGDRLGEANVLNLLGAVQHARGAPEAARPTLQAALELYRELGDPAGEAECLVGIANVALGSGAIAGALDFFGQALTIAENIASLPIAASALEGIATCQRLLGRQADSTVALGRALEICQRIGSPAADRLREALSSQP